MIAGEDAAPPPLEAEPAARISARALLICVALALVVVPFGLLLFFVKDRWRPLLHVDEGARDGLHETVVQHPWMVDAMKTVSFVGSAAVYVPVFAVIAGWLLWRGRRRLSLFVVLTVLGSSLLNALVKLGVDRARPALPDPVAHAAGASFPSGHAQGAIVSYGVLLLLVLPALRGPWRRLAAAVAAVMVVAIGLSRIGLGVHYVSDVLAGYVLGGAWLALMTAVMVLEGRARR